MTQITHKRGPLLTGRKFIVTSNDIPGRITWYSPLTYLKDRYPSVIEATHYDTTSSAGDWNGYVIQYVRKKYYLTLFHQENRYPKEGFSVKTADKWLLKGNTIDGIKNAFKQILPSILA